MSQLLYLYKKALKMDWEKLVQIDKKLSNPILHPIKNNNGNADAEEPTSTKTASE